MSALCFKRSLTTSARHSVAAKRSGAFPSCSIWLCEGEDGSGGEKGSDEGSAVWKDSHLIFHLNISVILEQQFRHLQAPFCCCVMKWACTTLSRSRVRECLRGRCRTGEERGDDSPRPSSHGRWRCALEAARAPPRAHIWQPSGAESSRTATSEKERQDCGEGEIG